MVIAIGFIFAALLIYFLFKLAGGQVVETNSFLHVGPGGDIARRRYCSNIHTMGELDTFMASLSKKEKMLLAVWESNNPPPSIGRDWLRHPETDYE